MASHLVVCKEIVPLLLDSCCPFPSSCRVRTPSHPQTRRLGGHFATNMLGSQSEEANCAFRASFSAHTNSTWHFTNIVHITKQLWEKIETPNSPELGSLKNYYETRLVESSSSAGTSNWLSMALGSVHVDSICLESTFIVFLFIFRKKKRQRVIRDM